MQLIEIMLQITTYLVLILSISTNILCELSDEIKRDFFNIYKGLAVDAKEIFNDEVTRDQIGFHMYRNKIEPSSVILNDSNLNLLEGTTGYVVFITHGWTDSGYTDWVLNMKDSFLHTYPDSVVICVDWHTPAMQPYTISSINVDDVGNFVADTIVQLVDKYHLNMSQFILVGHSLGAHVSGFSGKALQKVGKKIYRIVALDPAGPLFDVRPTEDRLNSDDAEVVHVIHTDGGTFGYKDPIGTIDFFPNGGYFQPGCTRVDLIDLTYMLDPIVCDHQRAYLLFIEAVLKPHQLVGKQCSEWSFLRKSCGDEFTASMGNMTTRLTGNFYLETNRERPYNKDGTAMGLIDRISKWAKSINIFKET